MVVIDLPKEETKLFKNWFEVYRSFGCCMLGLLGIYTMVMTHKRNRCVDLFDTEEPILPIVLTGHMLAGVFFSIDMLILILVKTMWRTDLFIHHCVCMFLLGYFTEDFPLVGSIFYIGETLTAMNWLRVDYPIGVTLYRLGIVLLVRFPIFGRILYQVAGWDDRCYNHNKSKQLAAFICFFFIYDLYVLWGCIQALIRLRKKPVAVKAE